MKKFASLIIAILIAHCLTAQEGHKINADIDLSFGLYYFDNDINNPFAIGASLGYEYDVNMFFGIEAGFRLGGYNQKTGYYKGPNILPDQNLKVAIGDPENPKTIYKGMYWAPYIAPKIYLPIGYDEGKDRPRFVFIENRFSYMRMSLDLGKANNSSGNLYKNRIIYEIRAGYQFPINERWGMSCWLGYSTFDFSEIEPSIIKHKNSTPIQIGIGFNYIISQ